MKAKIEVEMQGEEISITASYDPPLKEYEGKDIPPPIPHLIVQQIMEDINQLGKINANQKKVVSDQ